MNTHFNTQFNDTGDKPRFIHKQNPVAERDYQIFEFKEEKHDYEPVGDYVLLDREENKELTDIKVERLVRFLNGKREVQDFSHLTTAQLLFQVVQRTDENAPTKMIFRTKDEGVSTENAVFTLEKGILDE